MTEVFQVLLAWQMESKDRDWSVRNWGDGIVIRLTSYEWSVERVITKGMLDLSIADVIRFEVATLIDRLREKDDETV